MPFAEVVYAAGGVEAISASTTSSPWGAFQVSSGTPSSRRRRCFGRAPNVIQGSLGPSSARLAERVRLASRWARWEPTAGLTGHRYWLLTPPVSNRFRDGGTVFVPEDGAVARVAHYGERVAGRAVGEWVRLGFPDADLVDEPGADGAVLGALEAGDHEVPYLLDDPEVSLRVSSPTPILALRVAVPVSQPLHSAKARMWS